ncbi:MAG: PQQ-binding-like beta-propeller repeat protein [Halobacteriota archaeon]
MKFGKGIAVVFVLMMLGSIFAGVVPAVAQASPETIFVSDGYETIMAAVTATRSGVTSTDVDSDGDGISDYDEINGFTWGNKTYFTNPYQSSTDRDPYDDYMEITGINMPTAVTDPGRHPCIPSRPDLGIDLEGIDVTTLTTISSTKTKEQGSSWTLVTETGWSITPEIGIEGGPTFKEKGAEVGITASGKITCEYHSKTTETTSKWSREEWSSATAVDTGKAAKLKFHLKIGNTGTDAAKNVKLRFNVMIGEEGIVDTIWTDVVEWSINPGEISDEMVISKDREGNDIVISLDELRSIESGTPITIKVTEVNAEVPWEDGWITWNDYKGEIEPVSSNIMFDFGGGDVREYYVWSGLHLLAEPPHPYIHTITLWEAIDRMVGVEDKDDGIYFGSKRMEKGWNFIFDNETANDVEEKLEELYPDWNLYDLLNLTIEQGWTLLVKAPDTEPPEVHWASYSEDRKTIMASVSDNEQVKNVTAHVMVGSSYEDIPLEDEEGDLIFTATLPEPITDTYDDYVTATDGKFVAIWNDIRLHEATDWWPMFRHDARHTGSSLANAPDDNNLLWKNKTGDLVSSSPVVADGKVYVLSYISDCQQRLFCYHENGTKAWDRPITGTACGVVLFSAHPFRIVSSPAVMNGKVFVGGDDGVVHCFDTSTGRELWRYDILDYKPAIQVGQWGMPSAKRDITSISVVDGKIYFQASYSRWDTFFHTSVNGAIFCLDEDGEALWRYPADSGTPGGVCEPNSWTWGRRNLFNCLSSPAIADDMVIVGGWIDPDHAYTGNWKSILYLNETNGEWLDEKYLIGTAQPRYDSVVSSPAVAGHKVFVGGWLFNKLYCLDKNTGDEIWNKTIGGKVSSSPAVANGKVFVGCEDNKIYCFDEDTGDEIWNKTTGNWVCSSPAVADGKVFVGSRDSNIYCFDEDTGDEIWEYTTEGPVTSSPAIANGKVFIGDWAGNIYCFGTPEPEPPTASIISISPTTALQGEDIIQFNGSGTDNDGEVKKYQWKSNIDGVISTSKSFSMPASELSLGTHTIFFKVKDDDGLWSIQDVGYVTVKSPNSPPVGAFNISRKYPIINEETIFNASPSYDPDGFIKKYKWDFGDGANATGKVVTHTYHETGNYNVTLNVTDYYGLTNTTTKTVSVYRDYIYTNEVGVTSTITVDSPSNLLAFLPDEYNDTDISHAIVLNVNVTDITPENGTDDAYVDITINVGDMDVETCKVFKAGFGFLPEVDDVTTLPTVGGDPSFSRDLSNKTVTVRLYVGDPLLGVVPPEEKEPTPTTTPTPTSAPSGGGGGGGGGTPLDSDGDGYLDIVERLMGTDPNDPCDPDPECAACLASKPTTPTPTLEPTATQTPTIPPATEVPTTPTPSPTPKQPGFEVVFAIAGLLAVAYLVLRRRK